MGEQTLVSTNSHVSPLQAKSASSGQAGIAANSHHAERIQAHLTQKRSFFKAKKVKLKQGE